MPQLHRAGPGKAGQRDSPPPSPHCSGGQRKGQALLPFLSGTLPSPGRLFLLKTYSTFIN